MLKTYKLNRKPIVIEIKVTTIYPTKIKVILKDKYKPYSIYTNRYKTVVGDDKFYMKFPQTPEIAELIISNMDGSDIDFMINDIKFKKLNIKIEMFDYKNNQTYYFIKFIRSFCENAGILSTGIYMDDIISRISRFRIDYVNVISTKDGLLKTPCLVNSSTAIMTVSKKYFLQYTVYERIILLLHEFSHLYLNKDIYNEIEADRHALMIYLGLGYPRVEAFKVFTKIFKNNPTEENYKRLEYIKKIIYDFDEKYNNIKFYPNYKIGA